MVTSAGQVVSRPVVRGTPLDPDDFLEQIAFVLDETTQSLPSAPAGVAISCFWHGLLFLDDQNEPLGPITTWQDTSGTETAQSLLADMDAAAYHSSTGCFIHPSYPMVRIAKAATSFSRHQIARMIGPAEWLMLNLFGADATSSSIASATGLTSLDGCAYLEDVLEIAAVSEKELPVISEDPMAGLLSPWADRWPELETIPWFPAVGDGGAAAVGSGCLLPSRAALTVGTSAAVRVIVNDPPEPPDGLFVYAIPGNRFVVGGAASNAGNVLRWARDVFKLPDDGVAAALAHPPQPGLKVESFLAGERSPKWPPFAEGKIEGIRLNTSALDILRGLIDSTSESIKGLVETIDSWSPRELSLVGSGGVVESEDEWLTHICTLIGRPIHAAPNTDASIAGAAILAWERLGTPPPTWPLGEPLCEG